MKLLRKMVRQIFPHPPPDISGPFNCPVCKTEQIGMSPINSSFIGAIQKHRHVHNLLLMETLYYEYYNCKKCGASDRDRLYALYLDSYFKKKDSVALLDIAPAVGLASYIKRHPNVKYRSMDLYMEGVDDHLDITNMDKYNDGQFDFIVCSHVLEHIPDDMKAMQELYRVLNPGGEAIMMVPIQLGLDDTLEDPSYISEADRWKYYGQDDHVRMYAKKDFVRRLESVGFKVRQLDIKHFGEDKFERYAIFPTSVLYIVTK